MITNKGSGLEFLPNDGRYLFIEIEVPDETYDAISAGKKYLYVVAVMTFVDELIPSGKSATASTCGRFNKNPDASLSCLSHNESRLLN